MKTENKIKHILFIISLIYIFYNVPNTGVVESRYLDLIHSIIKEKNFNIDEYHYNTCDKSFYKDHYYSITAPGLSIIALPSYIIFNYIWKSLPESFKKNYYYARSHLTAISKDVPESFISNYPHKEFIFSHIFINIFSLIPLSLILTFIIYKISRIITDNSKLSIYISLFFSLGTIIFHYSIRLWAHIPGTLFAFLSFYIIFITKLKNINKTYFFLSGLCAGISVFIDYYLFILWLFLFIYLLSIKPPIKNVIYYICGSILPVLILLFYQWKCFENPFSISYQHSVYHQNIYGRGFLGVRFPSIKAIEGIILGPKKGYFFYMPVLILAIFGFFCKWNISFTNKNIDLKYEKILCIAITSTLFLFNISREFDWYIGKTFGPRYLIPTIPFMFISLCFFARNINIKILFLFGLISIFINLLGAQFIEPDNFFENFINLFSKGLTSSIERFSDSILSNNLLKLINWIFPVSSFLSILFLLKYDTPKITVKIIIYTILILLSVSNYLVAFNILERYFPIEVKENEKFLNSKNQKIVIPVDYKYPVKGIHFDTSLSYSVDVPQGAKIAHIKIFFSDSKYLETDIIAGVDTSEWAIRREDVRKVIKHRQADVSRWKYYIFNKKLFRGNISYKTIRNFKAEKIITSIFMDWTYKNKPGGIESLNINRIILIR